MLNNQELTALLRQNGYKVTPQRLAVYEALANTKQHPSAEMLFGTLQPKYPSMSFATVYKTVEILNKLGLIQIITGMIISVVRKVQAGQVADAIWDEVTWWIILAGIALAVLGIGSVGGYPVVLIVGLVMLLYAGTRNAKGFGKITSLIGTVYNGATGFFSDILSCENLLHHRLHDITVNLAADRQIQMPVSSDLRCLFVRGGQVHHPHPGGQTGGSCGRARTGADPFF